MLNEISCEYMAGIKNELITLECPGKGHVGLRLNGSIQSGRLDGYIEFYVLKPQKLKKLSLPFQIFLK